MQIKSLIEPKSISVDWINYRLYIIDARSNTILSSNLQGDFIVTVTSTVKDPLNLVVNPVTRFVNFLNFFLRGWTLAFTGIGLRSPLTGTDKKFMDSKDSILLYRGSTFFLKTQ